MLSSVLWQPPGFDKGAVNRNVASELQDLLETVRADSLTDYGVGW